jgi:DNA helicase-2/ATP-dependent DNA helicase PcrA
MFAFLALSSLGKYSTLVNTASRCCSNLIPTKNFVSASLLPQTSPILSSSFSSELPSAPVLKTSQQQAFLDELTSSNHNLALLARAGCGKTSTILMGVDAIAKAMPAARILVVALNKAIVDEIKGKLALQRTCTTRTMHALGFELVKLAFETKVDNEKVRKLAKASLLKATLKKQISESQFTNIVKLVGYAKGAGFGFFPDKQVDNADEWVKLADHFDVGDFPSDSHIITFSQSIYRASMVQTKVVDFADMLLFPLVKNLPVKYTKDVIFADEAQDLSPVQQALLYKFVKSNTGRMIVVGDDRQAIYGFSGADADALASKHVQNLECKSYATDDVMALPCCCGPRCTSLCS